MLINTLVHNLTQVIFMTKLTAHNKWSHSTQKTAGGETTSRRIRFGIKPAPEPHQTGVGGKCRVPGRIRQLTQKSGETAETRKLRAKIENLKKELAQTDTSFANEAGRIVKLCEAIRNALAEAKFGNRKETLAKILFAIEKFDSDYTIDNGGNQIKI